MFKIPKNDSKYHWTNHVIRKMGFYGLSPDRVKRIIRNPKRVEEGIAENTIGVMSAVGGSQPEADQPLAGAKTSGGQLKNNKLTWKSEIWVMFQKKNQNLKIKNQNSKIIIISAWRYPGVSPVGKKISIPQDILEELKNDGIL